MIDPLTWPTWLQTVLVAVVVLLAVLAWFTINWGGLLVLGVGVLFAVYLRTKNSKTD